MLEGLAIIAVAAFYKYVVGLNLWWGILATVATMLIYRLVRVVAVAFIESGRDESL